MAKSTEYSLKILETIFRETNYDRKNDLGQRFILPGVIFNEEESTEEILYPNLNESQMEAYIANRSKTGTEKQFHSFETKRLPRSKTDNHEANNNGRNHPKLKKMKSLAIIPTWINVPTCSRFFVIKSTNLSHVKKSFYNGIWSSTHFGNRKLSQAFRELNSHARLFLLFSVNSSGRFCGVAEMVTDIESQLDTSLWDDNHKFGAAFRVRWVIVKDLNNKFLKRFIIAENDRKPITNSRDTQEVPFDIGQSVLKLFIMENSMGIQCFLDPEYE